MIHLALPHRTKLPGTNALCTRRLALILNWARIMDPGARGPQTHAPP